jgi:hypothetical protein
MLLSTSRHSRYYTIKENKSMGLSNTQQALLMLAAFFLPILITWTANGTPTDRTSVSLVISGLLGGFLAFIKEMLGGKAPPQTGETT